MINGRRTVTSFLIPYYFITIIFFSGANVIIGCRNETKAKDAVNEIKTSTGLDNISYQLIDVSSFTSVKTFAENILRNEKSIDILINNAGGPLIY